MNQLKPGTTIYGIRPEMVMCHGSVVSVYNKRGFYCMVTSGVGKKHSKRSLHYVGYALDYRTKHLSDDVKRKIVKEIQEALPCCDVVLEHLGEEQEHIHVEYDPKDDEQFQADKAFYKIHGKWPHGR